MPRLFCDSDIFYRRLRRRLAFNARMVEGLAAVDPAVGTDRHLSNSVAGGRTWALVPFSFIAVGADSFVIIWWNIFASVTAKGSNAKCSLGASVRLCCLVRWDPSPKEANSK